MFDPHAHGEILFRHFNAAQAEHFKRISRAVPHSRHQRRRLDFFFFNRFPVASFRFDFHGVKCAAFDFYIRKFRAEKYFCAVCKQIFAHVFHHGLQFIAADMRLVQIENFFRRAEFHEFRKNFVVFLHVRTRIQFSVGKSSRTALAERHVAFRIQIACFMKTKQRFFPLFHTLSTLDHHGNNAVF